MTTTFLSVDEESIVAQCTPAGSGAIALIRLSGENAIAIADHCAQLPQCKRLGDQVSHTIHYGWVTNELGKRVDQVLFLLMKAPSTFTGQDTVEITCHNNPFLIEEILSVLIKAGARLAMPGEFSRRAVMTGKIDLLQAEAINDLIHANTQYVLKQSMAQLEGTFSKEVQSIEQSLLKALAFCQASFEFIDEEIEFSEQLFALIKQVIASISVIKKRFGQQEQIREGIKIALIGSVNAGKSSLFNALLDKDRSIVTSIPGTTRDVVEAGLYRKGNYWTLIDTAGLRQTDDLIERVGIERSYEQAQIADHVLLIIDGSRSLSLDEERVYKDLIDQYDHKMIYVVTKADLPQLHHSLLKNRATMPVCSSSKEHIQSLESTLMQRIDRAFSSIESPYLLNKRQHHLLATLEHQLTDIVDQFETRPAYELIAYHLNESLASLAELTGKTISESAMDAVFKEFCVGK